MKVAVIGAGIAGLRTAMLLEEAGMEVTIYEASSRVGGRMYTVDEGQGVLYEAGGEWIDADHSRSITLLNSLGIGILQNQRWPKKLIFNQEQTTEAQVWPDALEDDIRIETMAKELCNEIGPHPYQNPLAVELDAVTMHQFLDQNAASKRGRWWVGAKIRSDEGEDLDRISITGWLHGYRNYLDREGEEMSAYRIPGGSRNLFDRMLHKLKAEIHTGCLLQRVDQTGRKIQLVFNGREETTDAVVLTVSPPAIERIAFTPALPTEKRCAIEACEMGRVVKIAWEFSEAWWLNEDWGGSMLCDGPLQQTWDGSLGPAPILTAYVCGEAAVNWTELGDPVRAGIYELSQYFPSASKAFVRGWFHNWVTESHSYGAFCHMAPGFVSQHLPHIGSRCGNICFAGEHTARWSGFIEGALESAERVAQELKEGHG